MKVREPHNVEAEQAFLGSIELEPHTISRASRLVRPADFFVERHSLIFQAMLDLDQAGSPIDLVTLADQLGSRLEEVGGLAYLFELEYRTPSALHLDYYAAIIRKYARLRRLIKGAGRIVRLAHRATPAPDEALALAEATLLALVKEERLSSVRPVGELIRAYLERLKAQSETGLGLSTGLKALDDLCGRLQPADLVLLAGEPGTLKTALTLKIARSATLAGGKVALFSLESSREQVVQRLLQSETGLASPRLRVGDLAAIGRALKALARELKLPLLAVSSLEPAPDDLARLRQLGSIQYEADIIWLCDRAGDNLWLKQARWRDGPAGTSARLSYDLTKQDFCDPE